MKIGYELSEKDYVDFNLNHYKTNKGMRKQSNTARYIMMIALFIGSLSLGYFEVFPMWEAILIGVMSGVLSGVFFKKIMIGEIKKTASNMLKEKDNKTLLGFRDLELREEGIYTISEYEEVILKWKAVEGILESQDNIFIYNSSVSAHIVPKSAFESKEQENEFVRMINEKSPSLN